MTYVPAPAVGLDIRRRRIEFHLTVIEAANGSKDGVLECTVLQCTNISFAL